MRWDWFPLRFGLHFLWFDLWIGAYIDRENRQIYICPLPCVVFTIGQRYDTWSGVTND